MNFNSKNERNKGTIQWISLTIGSGCVHFFQIKKRFVTNHKKTQITTANVGRIYFIAYKMSFLKVSDTPVYLRFEVIGDPFVGKTNLIKKWTVRIH